MFTIVVSIQMSENDRTLLVIIHHQRGETDETAGMNIRKKVDQAISCKKIHVTAQFKSLRRSVHLIRVPDEPGEDEQAHQSAKSDLHNVDNIYSPEWGAALKLAH